MNQPDTGNPLHETEAVRKAFDWLWIRQADTGRERPESDEGAIEGYLVAWRPSDGPIGSRPI